MFIFLFKPQNHSPGHFHWMENDAVKVNSDWGSQSSSHLDKQLLLCFKEDGKQ